MFRIGYRLAATMAVAAAMAGGEIARGDDGKPGDLSQDIGLATADPGRRVDPTVRPEAPEPARPQKSTPENVDTGKPVHEWQRATDDWVGARPWLEDRGISLNASLSIDIAGGMHTTRGSRGWVLGEILDVNLTVDTQKLLKLDGGTFFVNFQNQASSQRVLDGAAQETFQTFLESRTQVSELWYEQKLFESKLRLKVGKIDGNSDFSHIASSEEFLNDAMSQSPTIFGLPSHPDPSPGVVLFAYPTKHLYIGGGLFDGSTIGGRPTGAHAVAISDVSNLFIIGEAGATWSLGRRRDGKLGAGVWHVSGDVPAFDGGMRNGATGSYVFLEQVLWRPEGTKEEKDGEEDDRGIAMFLQFGQAGPSYSPVEYHVGGGVSWKGPFAGRDEDVLGVGITAAELGHDAEFSHDHELVAEVFYRLQATKFISIKPDLQYVRHPGENAHDHSFVAGVRMIIDF